MATELAPFAASSQELQLHKVPFEAGRAHAAPRTDLQGRTAENSNTELPVPWMVKQQQPRTAYKKHSDVNAGGFNKRQGSFSRMKNMVHSEQATTDARRSIQTVDKVKMNKKLQL